MENKKYETMSKKELIKQITFLENVNKIQECFLSEVESDEEMEETIESLEFQIIEKDDQIETLKDIIDNEKSICSVLEEYSHFKRVNDVYSKYVRTQSKHIETLEKELERMNCKMREIMIEEDSMGAELERTRMALEYFENAYENVDRYWKEEMEENKKLREIIIGINTSID